MRSVEKLSLNKNAKEAILDVAVDYIRSGRVEDITTRNIAKAACVNVGAVNYYFNAKANLIDEAFHVILGEIKDSYSVLENVEIPAKERFRLFLIAASRNITAFPDLFRYLWMADLPVYAHSKRFLKFKDIILENLIKTISEITGEKDEAKLHVFSFQIMGAIVFPNIISDNIRGEFGYSSLSIEDRVDILLENFK